MRHFLRPTLAALVCLAWAVGPAAAQKPEEDVDALMEQAIKSALKKISPSVVAIETSGGTDVIIGGPRGGRILKGTGPTSGLVVAEDGHIITSAFNFANKPTSIFVVVPGQGRKVAKVVGTDYTRMLTLLKVDASGLVVPRAVPKKDIKIGHTSLAIGRTLVANPDQVPSVSQGIISAVDRIWGKAIQSDAKISPVNYGGPLIDLEGRVQGVLVPASPTDEGETAGFQWYDSGIGFAIPLEDIFAVLPRLKKGDLKKGLLGVTFSSRDRISVPPTVGSVSPDSAAAQHGVKNGDIIVEVDGKAVENVSQFLHQLGNKYEGDIISLKIKRGNDFVTLKNVKLGSAVAAYNLPFLGILPMRDDDVAGVEVRYVFANSGAAQAGIKEGDRITKIGPTEATLRPVRNRDELASLIATTRPGTKIVLEITPRGDKNAKKVTVTLGEMTDEVPAKLPEKASKEKARGGQAPKDPKKEEKKDEKKDEKKEDPKVETGLLKRSNNAQDRTYWIYVPDNYDANISHSLIVWLHPVGKGKEKDMETITEFWQKYCEDHHAIMVCPKAEQDTGWTGTDAEFVLEATRAVLNTYTIDRRRVVAHGMGSGGSMAFYLGFSARDLFRGVASNGAVLANNPKERVAGQPLSFFIVIGDKDPIREAVKASHSKLKDHRYTAIFREMKDKGHQYFDEDSEDLYKELGRWIDALDRI